jgi:hypothetical protein
MEYCRLMLMFVLWPAGVLLVCRMVCTEQDSPESLMHVVKVYHGLVNGLEVVSEFDKWPIRS